MVQLLMIVVFGSIYLHDEFGDAVPGTSFALQNPVKAAGITLLGFYAIWIAFHLFAAWCGSQIDKTGRVRWVHSAEKMMTLARIGAACWWLYALFELGWLRAVRSMVGDLLLVDELLAMAPFVGVLVGAWWSMFPVDRRYQEAILVRQLDDPRGLP